MPELVENIGNILGDRAGEDWEREGGGQGCTFLFPTLYLLEPMPTIYLHSPRPKNDSN